MCKVMGEGVFNLDKLLSECYFYRVVYPVVSTFEDERDTLYVLSLGSLGRITVLDRVTGYGCGVRDIETGYKDSNGRFWLASGLFDVREFTDLTVREAIERVKLCSNTCVGKE